MAKEKFHHLAKLATCTRNLTLVKAQYTDITCVLLSFLSVQNAEERISRHLEPFSIRGPKAAHGLQASPRPPLVFFQELSTTQHGLGITLPAN